MFYNNGIIFQTTFEQEINIPKLGESLAEALNYMKQAFKICNYPAEDYKKLIFETEDVSIVILKLGEDSNLALFFKKEDIKDLNLTPIRRYITRIEELIDMDRKELILKEIIAKEEELKVLNNQFELKLEEAKKFQEELDKTDVSISDDEKRKVSKVIADLKDDSAKLKEKIDQINHEMLQLKGKIEGIKK
ncbi:MAG: hypothetical protein ACFE9I_07395 [Candidatus Hermodarchaeota archaeon]